MKKRLAWFFFWILATSFCPRSDAGELFFDASCKIILPPDADETAKFAAEELQWHFGEITGERPEVLPFSAQVSPAVYLNYEKCDPEHWKLTCSGKNLYISGGYPRGILYGVYELLERFANCRWFSPEVSRIPEAPGILVPEALELSGEPWYKIRMGSYLVAGIDHALLKRYVARSRTGYDHWVFWKLEDKSYRSANRIGSPGMTHTFYAFQQTWENTKPEYYAMLEDGNRAPRMQDASSGAQFCLSNQEVRDRVFEQLLQYIKQDRQKADDERLPWPEYYAISPNDNPRFCLCLECAKLNRGPLNCTDTYIAFINHIAGRLASQYPEIKIVASAYLNTKFPPSIKAAENVLINFAYLDSEFLRDCNADVTRPMQHPVNSTAREHLQNWQKMAGSFWGHQYAQHFVRPSRIPYDVTRKMAADLKCFKSFCRASTMEMYELDNPFFWLKRYVLYKLLLDPEQSLQNLVEEFIRGYYGASAEPMLKYYDLLAEATEREPLQIGINPITRLNYLNRDFFQKADEYLDEAEKLAKSTPRILRDVQWERIPMDGIRLHAYGQLQPALDKEILLQRYFENKQNLFSSYQNIKGRLFHSLRFHDSMESEKILLSSPVPEPFQGRHILSWFAASASRDKMNDPDAAGGVALKRAGDSFSRPFRLKLHDQRERKDFNPLVSLNDFPADEKYHWYYVNTAEIYSHIMFWCPAFYNDLNWAIMPPPENRYEIHVSMKFTGPFYVPGSKQENAVFLDRIVAVRPE